MNVVITGASKGIGLELCHVALNDGHDVLAVARTATKSKGLTSLSADYKGKLSILDLDITDSSAPAQILKSTENWSAIDILINNAGMLDMAFDEKALLNSFRVNAIAPFLLAQALLPRLKKSAAPVLTQITSKMGSIEDAKSGGHYGYRASKAALNMFNKCLAVENPWLSAIVLHPGWVQTDMGGASAPVKVQDSARGIWTVTEAAKDKSYSGKFFDYEGNALPW